MEDKFLLVILLISVLFILFDMRDKHKWFRRYENMTDSAVGTPASPILYSGPNPDFKGLPIAIYGVTADIANKAVLKKSTVEGKTQLVQDETYRKFDTITPWIYSGPVEEYRGLRVAYAGNLSGAEIDHLSLIPFPKNSSWYGWLRIAAGCEDTSLIDPTINTENESAEPSEEQLLQDALKETTMTDRLTKILHDDTTTGLGLEDYEKMSELEKEAIQAAADKKKGIQSVDSFTGEKAVKQLGGDGMPSIIPSAVPRIVSGMKLSELTNEVNCTNAAKPVSKYTRDVPFEQLFEDPGYIAQYEDVNGNYETRIDSKRTAAGANLARKYTLQS